MTTQSTHETQSATGVKKTTPIKALSVIRTGTGEMHAQHLEGSRLHPFMWIFFGRKWIPDRPVSVFIIEHEDGLIIFDVGMSLRIKTDPEYWPDRITRMIMNKIFRFEIGPEDTLTRKLELAGYAASDVRKAVVSHLHFDHVGCISEIPQAELLVAADAWEHMLGPHPEREAVLRRDIDIPGARWSRIEFEPVTDDSPGPFTMAHDVMGDGSLVMLPTPGHMPGSTSLLIRTDPPVLLVGDLCYSLKGLMEDIFPGTGEKEILARSYADVRTLMEQMPGLLIVPSHDPEAVARLKAHPLFSAAT